MSRDITYRVPACHQRMAALGKAIGDQDIAISSYDYKDGVVIISIANPEDEKKTEKIITQVIRSTSCDDDKPT